MTSTTGTSTHDLRERMVDHIKNSGHLRSERIEQAMQTVPRHEFVPAATVEDAYADKAITIKPGTDRPASCISVPTVVAMMLGQLDPQPGENILEIGAGTGYNAALLAELVGPTGNVTTVDIHPDVTSHARKSLKATGHDRVCVITEDGALGDPDHAPFDKIIVTVGPWDLPPAWFDQLAVDGRLVVPLHWRGQARSVAFTRHENLLRADDSQLCGFIPMIGIVPVGELTETIADGVALYWDRDQDIDPAAMRQAVTQDGTTTWSGASVASGESFDGVWLLLTAIEPGICRLAVEPDGNDDLVQPIIAYRAPAIVNGDSIAYLGKSRPIDKDGERRFELGSTGHGPSGAELAERMCDAIRRWDQDRTAQPVITAWPVNQPDDKLPTNGLLVAKQHTRLVLEP